MPHTMGSSEGDEEQQEKEVSTKEEELPRDAVPCQVTISSSVALHPCPGPCFGLAPLLIVTHRWTRLGVLPKGQPTPVLRT